MTENKNSVNTVALALTAAGSALLTNSHQLHSKAGLPTRRGEDCPPVKKVGRDQRRLAEGVRPDQHQVNRVTHRKHGGRVRHFTTFSCKAKVNTNYKLSTDNKLSNRIKTADSYLCRRCGSLRGSPPSGQVRRNRALALSETSGCGNAGRA